MPSLETVGWIQVYSLIYIAFRSWSILRDSSDIFIVLKERTRRSQVWLASQRDPCLSVLWSQMWDFGGSQVTSQRAVWATPLK